MRTILLALFALLVSGGVLGQEEESYTEKPLGLRIKRNGLDYLIYVDNNGTPDFQDYRKLNYQVYFRKITNVKKKVAGLEYQLITIPGKSTTQNQNSDKSKNNPSSGKTVSKEDYDNNFWIEANLIESTEVVEREYYKYSNSVFSGLLTAPFKYRLKLGNVSEAILDGDFNIAPFIGWKWRLSSNRPYYLAPFVFGGITTLGYNSANNVKIINADHLENGTGLTYGLGVSVKFGSISPGIILGWDKGFGNIGSGFLYNDKAWLSFSINYDFFKSKKNSDSQ